MAESNNGSFSSGELLHFNSVRMRVTGSGNLQTFLRSLDDVSNTQLPNIAMAASTNKEPTILANFTDQRAQVEVRVTEIDEHFTISYIHVFWKFRASEYPR